MTVTGAMTVPVGEDEEKEEDEQGEFKKEHALIKECLVPATTTT